MKQFDPSMLFHISAIDEYRKLCYDKKDGAVKALFHKNIALHIYRFT